MLMSNTYSITVVLTRDVCPCMYQVLVSDRYRLFTSRVTLLCPHSIRNHNTKRRRGYRWTLTRFLPVGKSMDCRSQATISWVVTSTHSWVASSDLKTNSFLHNTKKMDKYCGKRMARPTHISDRNSVDHLHLVFVSASPALRGYSIAYLALSIDIAACLFYSDHRFPLPNTPTPSRPELSMMRSRSSLLCARLSADSFPYARLLRIGKGKILPPPTSQSRF
jgi:hypothetical protein